MNGYYGNLRALGYQQFAAGGVDTVQALTVPAGTALAVIIPEAQAIRWRDDGTNPTSAVGMPLAVGATLLYDSSSISRLRVIAQVAGAVLNISYYGPVVG